MEVAVGFGFSPTCVSGLVVAAAPGWLVNPTGLCVVTHTVWVTTAAVVLPVSTVAVDVCCATAVPSCDVRDGGNTQLDPVSIYSHPDKPMLYATHLNAGRAAMDRRAGSKATCRNIINTAPTTTLHALQETKTGLAAVSRRTLVLINIVKAFYRRIGLFSLAGCNADCPAYFIDGIGTVSLRLLWAETASILATLPFK